MNLFEDDNKNEAAPAQEPVSAKPAESQTDSDASSKSEQKAA